jgi:hypothetical protein
MVAAVSCNAPRAVPYTFMDAHRRPAMRSLIVAVIIALALVLSAVAGPPKLAHIGADAAGFAHFDLEKAAGTDFGKMIIEGIGALDGIQIDGPAERDWIEEMTTGLEIEVGRDLRGVTAWGSDSGDEESGVMLWYGSAKLDRWETYLIEKADAEWRTIEHDDRTIKALYTPGLDEYDVALRLGDDRRLWVTAWSEADLVEAVNVIEGRSKALQDDTPLMPPGGMPDGTFIFISAADLQAIEDFEPASQIARQADALWLSIGQKEADAFAQSVITATDEADAESIVQVLQGIVALGRLTLGSDEDSGEAVMKVLDGIRFESEGARVKMDLRYAAKDIRALLEETE